MGANCCGCCRNSAAVPQQQRSASNGNLLNKNTMNELPLTVVVSGPSAVRALYDYSAMQDGDLSFSRGDLMIIVDDSDPDWPVAQDVSNSGREGKIPSNYVVKEDDNSLEAQDWWFAVDRREAERLLFLPEADEGHFLVRPTKDADTLALSLRSFDTSTQKPKMRHYKIRKKENGQVFINSEILFWSPVDLVEYYEINSLGAGVSLTKPCPREPEPIPFKDLELPIESLVLEEELGSGNFGVVWKGKWNSRVAVAIKTLKEGKMEPEIFLAEAKTMHKLRHRKLVQLIGVCAYGDDLYIVTELMENGALRKFLRDDNGEKLNMATLINMAAQVSEGMDYLEQQKYIHRDLRADNILVDKHLVCKVADFGMARLMENETYASSIDKFPIRWTSPESLISRIFTSKSDVWSYGILLYEIVTYGINPYPGMKNQEVKTMVHSGQIMSCPSKCGIYELDCPEKAYDVMRECWNLEPEQRPSFLTLKKTVSKLADELMQIQGPYDEWTVMD